MSTLIATTSLDQDHRRSESTIRKFLASPAAEQMMDDLRELRRGVMRSVNAEAERLESLISQPRQENQAGEPPQETPQQQDNATQGQPPLEPQIQPSPSNSNQSQKPRYKTLNGWKTALEVIGILFAIGYAVVTYCQWRDLRHNFEATERAWIKVDAAFPPSVPVGSMPVIVQTTNIGKSITTKVALSLWIEVVNSDQSPNLSETGGRDNLYQNLVFPGEITKETFKRRDTSKDVENPITETERDQILSGRAYVTVHGIVYYHDEFGVHWTRFCDWKSYSPGYSSTGPCVTYNSAGEGNHAPPFAKQ